MAIQPTHIRKPFYVTAQRVGPGNMALLATWCKGTIEDVDVVREDGKSAAYIKVPVLRPMNDRQTRAHFGDWVVKAGKGFKVYSPKAFDQTFNELMEPKHYGKRNETMDNETSRSEQYVTIQETNTPEETKVPTPYELLLKDVFGIVPNWSKPV